MSTKNNEPISRGDQIGENIGAFFCGMLITIMVMLFFGLLWMDTAREQGYKSAYDDYRGGNIEAVVKKKFPDLWIKYHAPDNPPEVR